MPSVFEKCSDSYFPPCMSIWICFFLHHVFYVNIKDNHLYQNIIKNNTCTVRKEWKKDLEELKNTSNIPKEKYVIMLISMTIKCLFLLCLCEVQNSHEIHLLCWLKSKNSHFKLGWYRVFCFMNCKHERLSSWKSAFLTTWWPDKRILAIWQYFSDRIFIHQSQK